MFASIFFGLDLKEVGVASMVLFAVIDIIGSMPIIIKIKQTAGSIHPLRATAVATLMIGFLFLGESILGVIGVGISEFAVAGSFVLFFMALEMILGIEIFKHKQDSSSSKTASIVPLAFPVIAGAGTMTSIVSLRAEFAQVNILAAIILNLTLVFVVLKLTSKIEKVLGKGGIAVVEKVFGIILLAIAIKLFTTNGKELF